MKDGIVANSFFWSIIKPFLINKGHIIGKETISKTDNKTIIDNSVLARMFKSHYINIAEKTSGTKPSHSTRDNKISDAAQAINFIVPSYLGHSSIKRIKTPSKNQIPLLTNLHRLKIFVKQMQKKYLSF